MENVIRQKRLIDKVSLQLAISRDTIFFLDVRVRQFFVIVFP